MSQMQGMDIAAVRSLAHYVSSAGQRLPRLIAEVDQALSRSTWQGKDADEFQHLWRSKTRTRLKESGRRLTQLAADLTKQANQQEQTSADLGAVGGRPSSLLNLNLDDLKNLLNDLGSTAQHLWDDITELGRQFTETLSHLGDQASDLWRAITDVETWGGDLLFTVRDWAGDIMDWAMTDPRTSFLADFVTENFGFTYIEDGDFYTTSETSMQSHLGFHDAYDLLHAAGGMDLDAEVVYFTDPETNTQYRLEFWRGSYGMGSAYGGEIGLYTRDPDQEGIQRVAQELFPGYYSTAQGDDQIRMTQRLYDRHTGELLFENDNRGSNDGDHYWNLAIRTEPGYTKNDLIQEGQLYFTNEAVRDAAVTSLDNAGLDPQIMPDGSVRYRWDE